MMALGEQYVGLMHRDLQVLVEVGDTVMIRMEVNKPIASPDILMFIGCKVAGVSAESVPGELAEIMLLGWC